MNLSLNMLFIGVLGFVLNIYINVAVGILCLLSLIITIIPLSLIIKSLIARSKSESSVKVEKVGDLVKDEDPIRKMDIRCKLNSQGNWVVFNKNAIKIHESVLVQWLVRNNTPLGLTTSRTPGFATVRGVTYSGWVFSGLQSIGATSIYREVYVEPRMFEALVSSRGIHTDHMGVSPKYTDGMVTISIKQER